MPSRARALGLWGLALAAGLALLLQVRYSADMSAFLPARPDEQQRVLIEQVQSGAASRTLLVGLEGGTAESRIEGSRVLARALRASGAFDQVLNGEGDAWRDAGTWLFENRYALSPAVTAGHFAPAQLRAAVDETLSLLGTPAGQLVKPLFDRDPTGETQRIAEALLPPQAPRSEGGVWVSRQAPRAVLLLMTRAGGGDLQAQAAAIELVRAEFAPLAAQGLRLTLSGAPAFAVDSRARIEREAIQLALTGTVVIGALLWFAFGSGRALLVAALPVLSGVVGGVVAVGAVFGNVHGLTLAFGSTLIGESVDYAIYYLMQAHRPGPDPSRPGWHAWLRDNWPTVRLGLLTSVCGFAALVFSGFPGLAQLGVFSIAGLCAAALATRHVLPTLAPDGAPGTRVRAALARRGAQLLRHLRRWRGPSLLLALAATALLVLHERPLWGGTLVQLSPIPAEALQRDAQLRADLGSGDARLLVVATGADAAAALAAAERAGERLEGLVAEGRIAGFDSPARWLPSPAMQRQRRDALPPPDALKAALDQALAGAPLRAERLGAFIADVQAARTRAPVTRESLPVGAVATAVDALLLHRGDGRWSALLPLHAPPGGAVDAAAVRAAVGTLEGVQVLDVAASLDTLYARYLREALWQAALGAAAVVALLALAVRSGRRLLVLCLPLALTVLLVLAGLVALRVPLGVLHLVGLLLVVAVGSNYALFFGLPAPPPSSATPSATLAATPPAPLEDDTIASLLLANLTTVLSFALIAASGIPALSAIGRVVAPGALLALLLAMAFAPPAPAPAEPAGGRPAVP